MQDSDKKAFDAAICTMLEACNRNYKPSRSVKLAYWEPLVERYTLQEVQAGIAYVIAHQVRDEHVTPGAVAAASRDQHQARLRADELRPKPSEVPESDPRGHDFDDCKHDAIMGFCMKVCGQTPGGDATDRYSGGSNWEPSVAAGPEPVSGREADHKIAWSKFLEILRYEWDQWREAKQA